ncbi:MAG: 23S rRNA (guanine1835-N2)-methyltransferase [Planctomycetota bacterium]|jgi:23S rRNA (guanine1835-N2)-methyltransferase
MTTTTPTMTDPDPTPILLQDRFTLQRNPVDNKLQAWDAADEHLLNFLAEHDSLSSSSRILILNDAFGALAVALNEHRVFGWSDSLLAQQALTKNLMLNDLSAEQLTTNTGIDFASDLGKEEFDFILIKIPKTLALLEHQLFELRDKLAPGAIVVAAGMARNIHSSTLALFETILGPTTTTRAWKKSRLINVDAKADFNRAENPYPQDYQLDVGREFNITNHANLFSREKLDMGSRFLLEHMPVGEQYRRIVDLGCGNGLLGIVAAERNAEASLLFSDESYMAIASARINFEAAFEGNRSAEFRVSDCLQGVAADSQDLVLVNPPFHQTYQIGDHVAWNMFKDARRVLVEAGELWVVGNRHLGYQSKLKKLFGRCDVVASNKKFVVMRAAKQ